MKEPFYTYLKDLHQFIESLARRVQQLEKSIGEMREELNRQSLRPPIHVDAIHYNFDQLKVETLEGTLNIGLNPTDLEAIENMEIDQQQELSKMDVPKKRMETAMEIEDSILQFLNEQLPALVNKICGEHNLEIKDEEIHFIRQDIEKQLPGRIEHYLNTVKKDHSVSLEQWRQQIKQKIIGDIEKGIRIYLQNHPDRKKD